MAAKVDREQAPALRSGPRPREVIAAEVSVLLGEDVSRAILDAYSSPAREGHKVAMSRFLALVAVCQRPDLLDLVLRPIGCAVLADQEMLTARLGQIDLLLAKLKRERAEIASRAPLIREGRKA